jgi:hypothetical protein
MHPASNIGATDDLRFGKPKILEFEELIYELGTASVSAN